jgi:repressor of nif and glnA expression
LAFFVSDFNEITPSTLLGNNIKVKEKFCVVLVHSLHASAQLVECSFSASYSLKVTAEPLLVLKKKKMQSLKIIIGGGTGFIGGNIREYLRSKGHSVSVISR